MAALMNTFLDEQVQKPLFNLLTALQQTVLYVLVERRPYFWSWRKTNRGVDLYALNAVKQVYLFTPPPRIQTCHVSAGSLSFWPLRH